MGNSYGMSWPRQITGIPDLLEYLPHPRNLGVEGPDAPLLGFVGKISHHPAERTGVQGVFHRHQIGLGTFRRDAVPVQEGHQSSSTP